LSLESFSFFTGLSVVGPRPRKAAAAAFLVTTLVRRPVDPAGVNLGVGTTNEEIDLSFILLLGGEIGDATSSALIFFRLNGKILDLTSCRL
jgi:hypothetical protein